MKPDSQQKFPKIPMFDAPFFRENELGGFRWRNVPLRFNELRFHENFLCKKQLH